jgi:hypothetical protein
VIRHIEDAERLRAQTAQTILDCEARHASLSAGGTMDQALARLWEQPIITMREALAAVDREIELMRAGVVPVRAREVA